MRVNSEIIHVDVVFPLHLFILRSEDIYCSHVYPLLLSLQNHPGFKPLIFSHFFPCEQYIHESKQSLRSK